jgi:histidinol phosphatase-like enzyme
MFQYQQTDKQQNPAIALHAMGLVMCHNLMVYPGYINQQIVDRVRNLQYTFGMTDAEFFPYWEKNPYGIETDNPGVVCSFYKNSKGLMLSVLNSTSKEQNFKLKIKDLGTDMPALQNLKMVLFEPLENKKSVVGVDTSIKLKPYMAAFMVIEK